MNRGFLFAIGVLNFMGLSTYAVASEMRADAILRAQEWRQERLSQQRTLEADQEMAGSEPSGPTPNLSVENPAERHGPEAGATDA